MDKDPQQPEDDSQLSSKGGGRDFQADSGHQPEDDSQLSSKGGGGSGDFQVDKNPNNQKMTPNSPAKVEVVEISKKKKMSNLQKREELCSCR